MDLITGLFLCALFISASCDDGEIVSKEDGEKGDLGDWGDCFRKIPDKERCKLLDETT